MSTTSGTDLQKAISEGFAKAASERSEKNKLYDDIIAGLKLLKADPATKGRLDFKEHKKYMRAKIKIDGIASGYVAIRSYGDAVVSVGSTSVSSKDPAYALSYLAEKIGKKLQSPPPGIIKWTIARLKS